VNGPQVGAVFAFSATHATTAEFYTDIVGLQAGTADARRELVEGRERRRGLSRP